MFMHDPHIASAYELTIVLNDGWPKQLAKQTYSLVDIAVTKGHFAGSTHYPLTTF